MRHSGMPSGRAVLAGSAVAALLGLVIAIVLSAGVAPARAVNALATPNSPTPTTTVACEQRPTTVTYRYASPSVLAFAYRTPGVPDCPGAVATIDVYSDAAGTQRVAGTTTPATSFSGNVNIGNLAPGTPFYYRISTGDPSALGPVQAPVTTQPAGTPPASVVCDVLGGTAGVRAVADTTLTFTYTATGALGCDLPGHPWLDTRLTLWTDQGGVTEVARTSAPAGSTAGVITVTGLTPGTDYYYRFVVINAFVQDNNIYGPVRTLGGSSPSPSTPAPTGTGTGAPTPAGCTATMSVLSSWRGGFTASVRITNTGPATIPQWRAAWTWTHGETLVEAYNAVVSGTPASPALRGTAWNRNLPAGQSTTITLKARTRPTQPIPTTPPITCTPS